MKTPQVSCIDEAADYLRNNGLAQNVDASRGKDLGVNEKLETRVPFKPDLIDLCRLHRLVIEQKRTTVLEFGTGLGLIQSSSQGPLPGLSACVEVGGIASSLCSKAFPPQPISI